MLASRARVAELYREALAGVGDLGLSCRDDAGNVRGWFVFVVQWPARVARDAVIRSLAKRGIHSKPYLPRDPPDELLSERTASWREEFPVCEGVAERSLALPFFPGRAERHVARVAERLLAEPTASR
jgi:perosamine synthetase